MQHLSSMGSARPGARRGRPRRERGAKTEEAWPTLPDPVRAGILAMVEAAVHGDEVVVADGDISSLQAVPFLSIMSMPAVLLSCFGCRSIRMIFWLWTVSCCWPPLPSHMPR